MELLDKSTFVEWMERLFERLDELSNLAKDDGVPTRPIIDGKPLLDNQDVCMMLKVSKRTLQRYRESGTLPFYTIYHKTWFKEVDIVQFMETHFTENMTRKRNRKSKKKP